MGLILKIFKYLLVLIISILLTSSLVLFAMGSSTKQVVFSTETYIQLLEKGNAYDLFQNQVGKMFKPQLTESGLFTEAEANQIMREVFSKKWFDFESKKLFENLFGYIKGENAVLDLKISLIEPKKKMVEFFSNKLEELSNGIPLSSNVDVSTAVKDIPDSMDLLQNSAEAVKQIDAVKQFVSILSTALIALLVFIIVLIALVFLILRNKNGMIFCFWAFFTSTVCVFTFPTILIDAIKKELPRQIPAGELSNAIIQFLTEFIGIFKQKMDLYVLIYSFFSMICFVAFIYLWIKGKKNKTAAKPVEEKPIESKPVEQKSAVAKTG